MPRWMIAFFFAFSTALWGCGLGTSTCTSESTDLWLYCEKTWSCDHGMYKVRCTMNGNGGVGCTCKEGDQEVGSFEGSGCDEAVLSDYNVQQKCGWVL